MHLKPSYNVWFGSHHPMFNSSEVIMLTNKQIHKQTNNRTQLKTSASLHYSISVGNYRVSLVPLNPSTSLKYTHSSAKYLIPVKHRLTQLFYGPLSKTTRELVPEETFTHSHLSWSSTILHQLPTSTTVHRILHVKFTCLTVFSHNLSPSPLWSTSWSDTVDFILNTVKMHQNFLGATPYWGET